MSEQSPKKHRRFTNRLTYTYIRRVKKWMFCPACQHGKMTIDKKTTSWICQNCEYKLSAAEFEDNYVFWFCDGCSAYLNNQEGFDRNAQRHICQCCGYENDTTSDNVKGICTDCGKVIPGSDATLCTECRKLRWEKAKAWLVTAGKILGITATVVGAFCLASQASEDESENSTATEFDYGDSWFEIASLEELQEERKKVQTAYRNPDLDIEYRGALWDLLPKFDLAIGNRRWSGEEYGYPAHREHGWYLPNDD